MPETLSNFVLILILSLQFSSYWLAICWNKVGWEILSLGKEISLTTFFGNSSKTCPVGAGTAICIALHGAQLPQSNFAFNYKKKLNNF